MAEQKNAIAFQTTLNEFLSTDGKNEDIMFYMRGVPVRKPYFEVNGFSVLKEDEVPEMAKIKYRDGSVIFIEDFEKYILPTFNDYINHKFRLIKEKEENFEETVTLLMQSKPFQEIVDDIRDTLIKNGQWRKK